MSIRSGASVNQLLALISLPRGARMMRSLSSRRFMRCDLSGEYRKRILLEHGDRGLRQSACFNQRAGLGEIVSHVAIGAERRHLLAQEGNNRGKRGTGQVRQAKLDALGCDKKLDPEDSRKIVRHLGKPSRGVG